MRRRRPLSPQSVKNYTKVLLRAFKRVDPGSHAIVAPEVQSWTEPMKFMLRAAVNRSFLDRGLDPSYVIEQIPEAHIVRRQVRIPGEADAKAYEKAADALSPPLRALALIPLALGLRAHEVTGLKREDVQNALRNDELIFERKGGREHTLIITKSKRLLEALIEAPRHADASGKIRKWERAGEILSLGSPKTQYEALRLLVEKTAKAAGLPNFSPHKWRHAFATRLSRDGASLFEIQYALDHANLSTTQLYVHPGAADVARHMRPM